jgi:hypothetical protein
MKDKITELTVYESPDGGRTIYKRKSGSSSRELYLKDPLLDQQIIDIQNEERWADIYLTRKTNPTLDDLCKQVELLYQLSKKE